MNPKENILIPLVNLSRDTNCHKLLTQTMTWITEVTEIIKQTPTELTGLQS